MESTDEFYVRQALCALLGTSQSSTGVHEAAQVRCNSSGSLHPRQCFSAVTSGLALLLGPLTPHSRHDWVVIKTPPYLPGLHAVSGTSD